MIPVERIGNINNPLLSGSNGSIPAFITILLFSKLVLPALFPIAIEYSPWLFSPAL